jgi:hypothetical protein
MEITKNIYQKLHTIQTKVMGLGKDKKSNSYEYVTGGKVLEHLKPLMNDMGLLLKQEVLSIENERMDYRTGIGTNYEKPKSEILSKVMMRFTWIDTESGEKDENLFGANGQNDWEKGLGSALTYGERYFLLKYFHIATDEDDIDNPDRKLEDTKTATPPDNSKKEADLPWLNDKDEVFPQICQAIKDGKRNVAQIRDKYKISKAVEAKLNEHLPK